MCGLKKKLKQMRDYTQQNTRGAPKKISELIKSRNGGSSQGMRCYKSFVKLHLVVKIIFVVRCCYLVAFSEICLLFGIVLLSSAGDTVY